MMRWPECLLLLVGLTGASCGTTPPPQQPKLEVTPSSLYPLTPGNAWSYDVDTGDGQNVLAITRVESQSGAVLTVRSGGEAVHYELREDGVYRPARQGYLLRSPITPSAQWDSGSGTQARVTGTELTMETNAGRFEHCVSVEERAPEGTRIETTYCPGVGPVVVMSELALSRRTARVVARLRGYKVISQQ